MGEKMRYLSMVTLVLIAALSSTAMAGITVDSIAASLQEQTNISQQEIEKKVVEHAVQGNLTTEHLTQDANAAKEQLKKQAVEHVNQSLNVTADQVSQMAKEELKNQVNQKVQQPGFEYILAISGIIGTALVLRRRN